MSEELPPLAEWLRWLSEMPPALRGAPEGFPQGVVRTFAVVADLFETLFGSLPERAFLAAFSVRDKSPIERNRHAWVLAACHVLWHPCLRGRTVSRGGVEKLLVQELAGLAGVIPADALDREEERREELVRRVVRAAGLALPGERGREGEDRLRQLDSIERRRVLVAAAEREQRARQVREAMARKAAEEAAAKVSRE
jgi:hypothetical protein